MNVWKVRLLSLSFVLITAASGAQAIAQDKIRLGGTGTGSLLLQHLVDTYAKSHPSVLASVVMPPLSSSGGLRALAAGSIQIAVVSVQPRPEDTGTLKITTWVRTPFVFTGRNVAAGTNLTIGQIADIYAGRLTRWPDDTQIRLVTRTERESDTKILRSLSPVMDAAVTLATKRIGIPFAENDVDNQQLLERTNGSFGAIALGQLLLSESPLKPIDLEGASPSPDNLRKGIYRPEKILFLVISPTASEAAFELFRYLQSPETLQMIERYGFIPAKR
ncbi:MAG: hypothetical protein H6R07_87 [Proteobacteria bacterium]|nr:hypothetical protein [Pseudomonadota bacterium]